MRKQIRYHCGHCDWFVLTDLYAESEEEAEEIRVVFTKRWEEKRIEHYMSAHAKLWKNHKLKRILMAAL